MSKVNGFDTFVDRAHFLSFFDQDHFLSLSRLHFLLKDQPQPLTLYFYQDQDPSQTHNHPTPLYFITNSITKL